MNDHPTNHWVKRAYALVILTMLYNVAEAIAAIMFGLKADSISLVGFGLDSIIEVSAAAVLLWHLTQQLSGKSDCELEDREQFVRRFIGGTFMLLAAYVTYQSGRDLLLRLPPEASVIGMIIAGLSLIIMPALAYGKIKAAGHIRSDALHMEAKGTIACCYLSLVLLVGLGLNSLLGWWWADPLAAVLMVPWLMKEGVAGLKGEACCGD